MLITRKASKDPFASVNKKAKKMFKRGEQAAKVHSAYLKAMAVQNGLTLDLGSSSSEDTDTD
jgi:hypothetical protein